MEKIVIFGSPGVGKTTFAQELGKVLKIEVIHLDRHFWKSGWKEYPREERIQIERKLIEGKDRWIIEGTFLSSSDNRLQWADTVIFLDMPFYLCLQQAVKRYFTYRGKFGRDIPDRPDMPAGCKEKLGLFYILKIFGFPYKGRKLFLKKMARFQETANKQGSEKNHLIFHSHEVSDWFLQELKRVLSDQRQMAQIIEEEKVYAQV